jgi:hypothetical protein
MMKDNDMEELPFAVELPGSNSSTSDQHRGGRVLGDRGTNNNNDEEELSRFRRLVPRTATTAMVIPLTTLASSSTSNPHSNILPDLEASILSASSDASSSTRTTMMIPAPATTRILVGINREPEVTLLRGGEPTHDTARKNTTPTKADGRHHGRSGGAPAGLGDASTLSEEFLDAAASLLCWQQSSSSPRGGLSSSTSSLITTTPPRNATMMSMAAATTAASAAAAATVSSSSSSTTTTLVMPNEHPQQQQQQEHVGLLAASAHDVDDDNDNDEDEAEARTQRIDNRRRRRRRCTDDDESIASSTTSSASTPAASAASTTTALLLQNSSSLILGPGGQSILLALPLPNTNHNTNVNNSLPHHHPSTMSYSHQHSSSSQSNIAIMLAGVSAQMISDDSFVCRVVINNNNTIAASSSISLSPEHHGTNNGLLSLPLLSQALAVPQNWRHWCEALRPDGYVVIVSQSSHDENDNDDNDHDDSSVAAANAGGGGTSRRRRRRRRRAYEGVWTDATVGRLRSPGGWNTTILEQAQNIFGCPTFGRLSLFVQDTCVTATLGPFPGNVEQRFQMKLIPDDGQQRVVLETTVRIKPLDDDDNGSSSCGSCHYWQRPSLQQHRDQVMLSLARLRFHVEHYNNNHSSMCGPRARNDHDGDDGLISAPGWEDGDHYYDTTGNNNSSPLEQPLLMHR